MKRHRIWIVVGIIMAALSFLVLRTSLARGPGPVDDGSAVRSLGPQDVAVASHGRIEPGVAVAGSLDPFRVVEVRAQLPGTIDRVLVDRGMSVRRGQLLALYDGATVQSQLAGAEAAVAAARSALVSATRDEEAAEALFEGGAISERDLRQTRSAAAAARAELKAAESRFVEAREAAGRARILSPLTGIVSARGVSSGEAVGPGQRLFTVVDADTLELAAKVAAHQIGGIKVGQPVVFAVDAYPGRRLEGSIARIDPIADAATRQITVYVYLPNSDGELVGGLYATGRILADADSLAITVPIDAVRGGEEEPYILVVGDGRIARKAVALGPHDPSTGRVAVRDGLEAGMTVVVGPPDGLEPGISVEVRRVPLAHPDREEAVR